MQNKYIPLLALGLIISAGKELGAKETKACVKIDEQMYILIPVDKEEPDAELSEKTKMTFYLDQEVIDKLDEVCFQRRRNRKKASKSAIICEAIDMLHEKEVQNQGTEI
jgi:hypothetical protein